MRFVTTMLISYKAYSGIPTSNIVNTSGEGVMTADTIVMITTACFRYLARKSDVTNPIFAKKNMTTGISKIKPVGSVNMVSELTNAASVVVLAISGLTLYAERNVIATGAIKKYPKETPSKKSKLQINTMPRAARISFL